jgi:hypothetical protein
VCIGKRSSQRFSSSMQCLSHVQCKVMCKSHFALQSSSSELAPVVKALECGNSKIEMRAPSSIPYRYSFVKKEFFWPSRQNPTFCRCASFPTKESGTTLHFCRKCLSKINALICLKSWMKCGLVE